MGSIKQLWNRQLASCAFWSVPLEDLKLEALLPSTIHHFALRSLIPRNQYEWQIVRYFCQMQSW
jgi:hypothetical protein